MHQFFKKLKQLSYSSLFSTSSPFSIWFWRNTGVLALGPPPTLPQEGQVCVQEGEGDAEVTFPPGAPLRLSHQPGLCDPPRSSQNWGPLASAKRLTHPTGNRKTRALLWEPPSGAFRTRRSGSGKDQPPFKS